MLSPNKQRKRLVHSYHDKTINGERIFVYSHEHNLVAEFTVNQQGEIRVVKGKVLEAA